MMKMDEFSGDNAEPVSTKMAVTKFIIVKLPTKNDNSRVVKEIRMDLIASGVTEIVSKYSLELLEQGL